MSLMAPGKIGTTMMNGPGMMIPVIALIGLEQFMMMVGVMMIGAHLISGKRIVFLIVKRLRKQQGPPSETSAIIPSLGQPLIEEIEDDHEAEAVSAALPTQSSSSGSRGRPPEPGLISKLFVGALMLIGTLSSGRTCVSPDG